MIDVFLGYFFLMTGVAGTLWIVGLEAWFVLLGGAEPQ